MDNFNESRCNTSLTLQDFAQQPQQTGTAIAVPTIFAFVVAIGFIGNLLVIIVVVSNKNMRNTTNVLITNLAVADLGFIIICVPFTAYKYSTPIWPFGAFWCKFIHYVLFTTAWTSVYTLVFMSFDRYLAVVHAITSIKLRTTRNAGICIGVLWVVMLLTNISAWVTHDLEKIEYNNSGPCGYFYNCNFHRDKTFVTCFLVFGYLLPLLLICILYGLMLKRLLCGHRPGGSRKCEGKSKDCKRRATRLVVIIVSIFAICWLPIHIVYVTDVFELQALTKAQVIFNICASILAYINSCVNPILYAFLSVKFRDGFKRILCCGRYNTYQSPTQQSRVSTRI